jgi:hypothetical protein
MPDDESPPSIAKPKIHAATIAADGSGAVIKAEEIDETMAVTRRRAGLDIVVCGSDLRTNHDQAQEIETKVGRWKRHIPHRQRAGDKALPHFQQMTPPPDGHSFYETPSRKAKVSS